MGLIGRVIKWIGNALIYSLSQLIKIILGFLMLMYMAIPFIVGGLVFLTITAFISGANATNRLTGWVTKDD